MVLGMVERGEWPAEQFKATLECLLDRDRDRALFELPPRLADGQ